MQIQVQLNLSRTTLVYDYDAASGTLSNTFTQEDQQNFVLDLFPDEKIPVTLVTSDPGDPGVRPTSFTKSFLIPGTSNNSKALNFPYMSSNDLPWRFSRGYIEGNKYYFYQLQGTIVVDGIQYFAGTIDLTNVNISQGEVSSYEINFLATEVNVFEEFNNKFLTSLPFMKKETTAGVTGIDIRNPDEIVTAMGVTGPDTTFTLGAGSYGGFTFAYPDFGFQNTGDMNIGSCPGVTGPSFNTTEDVRTLYATGAAPANFRAAGLRAGYNLQPFKFVKSLIDDCFDNSVYDYTSEFMETDFFKSLLLLYYDNSKPPSNNWMFRYGENPTNFFPDRSIANPVVVRTIEELDECSVPNTWPVNAGQITEDLYSFWDTETYAFTLPASGTYKIRIKAKAIVRFGWDQLVGGQGGFCPGGTPNTNPYPHSTYPLIGPNSSIDLRNAANSVVAFQTISNPTKIGADILGNPNTYTKNGTTHYQWEAAYDLYSTPIEFTFTGVTGDIFRIVYAYDAQNYYAAPVASGCSAFPVADRLYEDAMDLIVEDIRISVVNWERTIPPITQKEFMQQVVKLFNLYFEVTPNSKKIAMEPRNDFFNGAEVLDWTDKVDISSPRQIEKYTPPNEVFLKYTDTQNFVDVERQKADNLYNLNYGSVLKKFINCDGIQNIELLSASPTPYLTWNTSYQIRPSYPQSTYGGTAGTYYNLPGMALYPKDESGNRQIAETTQYYFAVANGLQPNPQFLTPGGTRVPVYVYIGAQNGVSRLNIGGTGGTAAAQVVSPFSQIVGVGPNNPGVDLNFKATSPFIWNVGSTILTADPLTFKVGTALGTVPPIVTNSKTLYEGYYEAFYNNLFTQRYYKMKVKLSPADYAQFSFRNPVYIRFPNGDAKEFLVVSISYDPTTTEPADVVLSTFNPIYLN